MTEPSLGEIAVDFILNLAARGGPLDDQITEDFSWWMSSRPYMLDVEQARSHVRTVGLPPVRFEVLGVVDGEDRAAVEIQGYCQLPDGRQYNNNYCFIFIFEGRRIRQLREHCDTQLAFEMTGPAGVPYKFEGAAAS